MSTRPSDTPTSVNPAAHDLHLIEEARRQVNALGPNRHRNELPPVDSFPGYQLTREIHRGGQGVVYQAIQKATKRKVAIKVLREGPFAGPHERTRFEREVAILGQLRHPNIVDIHDSGSVAGNYFYVMDYISGQPLDVYVASAGRSVPQLLELFLKICDAVNAAHLRGVIHRDLKPANIRIDAAGDPHVVDFGLAKIATGELASEGEDAAPMTITGQFVGSLPWASPEQAEGRPDKIDVRTDVYSLGVILYQMLTGRFPYAVAGPMREVQGNIMTAEPVKPRSFNRRIDDELETITLKCLKKDRERRYQSAGEVARDLRHYLAGEPIEAKRDSSFYMLRKAVRRNRGPVVVAGVSVLVLAAFAATMTVQYRRAHSAEELFRQLQEFTLGVFLEVKPDKAQGEQVTVLKAVNEGVSKLEREQARLSPEVTAALHEMFGEIYFAQGFREAAGKEFSKAREVAERSTTRWSSRKSLEAMAMLATTLRNMPNAGKAELDESESLFKAVLARWDSTPEVKPEEKALIMSNYARLLELKGGLTKTVPMRDEKVLDHAESLYRDAIALRGRVKGKEDTDVLQFHAHLGRFLMHRGRLDEARRELDGVIQSAAKNDKQKLLAATTRLKLGDVHERLGQPAEAAELYRSAVASMTDIQGEKHPDTINATGKYADCLRGSGDIPGAAAEYEKYLAACAGKSAAETPRDLPKVRGKLGECLLSQGKLSEAEPHLRAWLDRVGDFRDDRHKLDFQRVARAAAELFDRLGQPGDAARVREQYVDAQEAPPQDQPGN